MEDREQAAEPDLDNLARLMDMYIRQALVQSNKALTTGKYDAVSGHIATKKVQEIFEQIKQLINQLHVAD